MKKLILTGDVNLMRVTDPSTPFRHVADYLRSADVVFSNLECCLKSQSQSHSNEGFFADPGVGGEALQRSGIHAVGIANNVNYGWDNISASMARLDEIGIPHTGAGANRAEAYAPVTVERNGLQVGALQRSSVYWPTDHEAHIDSPGIAVLKGHTAYHVPMGRITPGMPPANRPGVPPVIMTWADKQYLEEFRRDIETLRPAVDILVASCHWGLGREPLQYMIDIAHAAIDAGADVVMGHGPHYPLPVEIYEGKPIFYGMGNLTFSTGHLGRKHAGWIGLMAELSINDAAVAGCTMRFVRANEHNESYLSSAANEVETLAELSATSAKLGARLTVDGDRVTISAP